MSGPHNVEITADPGGRGASVLIDGVEHHNTIRAYTIHHVAGERPTIVTLTLLDAVIFQEMRWKDRCDLRLGPATTDLLVALGWTPPDEPEAVL